MSSAPNPSGEGASLRNPTEKDAGASKKSAARGGGFCRVRKDWANSGSPAWPNIAASSATMSTTTRVDPSYF